MKTYVALLRAVNVGGTGKVPMEELRQHLTTAGLESVETYIASGNVVFQSELSVSHQCEIIDGILHQHFGLTGKRATIRDAVQLQRLVKHNPYTSAAAARPNLLHVHFLMQHPRDGADVALTSFKGPERMRLDGDILYIDYPNGAGQSQLTPRFLEQALGTVGTSRNWNTVLKLAEMANAAKAPSS